VDSSKWISTPFSRQYNNRRLKICGLVAVKSSLQCFHLTNTAVISINDFWKLMWAKSYLGAIGRNFVWALAPWLPRPWLTHNHVWVIETSYNTESWIGCCTLWKPRDWTAIRYSTDTQIKRHHFRIFACNKWMNLQNFMIFGTYKLQQQRKIMVLT